MERDLSLLRKKRLERERIANGLKAQSSPADATEVPQLGQDGPVEDHSTENSALVSGETKVEDIVMLDSAQAVDPLASNDELQAEELQKKESDDNINNGQGMPQDAENSMELAVTIPVDPATDATQQSKSPEKKNSGATPAAEVPLDSSAVDLDFESMFNDTDLAGGGDAIDFGLDFASEGNLNQDVLNDSAFASIEMNNADISNLGATTTEDINTLLPGLESYVNAGADFSNVNIPGTSTLPETTQAAPSSTTDVPSKTNVPSVIPDSDLDDLFGSVDFAMDGTGDDGMGVSTLGELEDFDDAWFKTD